MHAQTLTDELARSTIAATGQLLGNILVEVLTQGDAGVLHLSLLVQGLNPIIPNIGIYLINICMPIERNSENPVGNARSYPGRLEKEFTIHSAFSIPGLSLAQRFKTVSQKEFVMKRLNKVLLTASLIVTCLPAWAGHKDHGYDRARVVSAAPVYETVRFPVDEQVCWEEQA